MLVHHDSRDYQTASKEAASFARAKIESLIQAGQQEVTKALSDISANVPKDFYLSSKRLKFRAQDTRLFLDAQEETGNPPLHLHPHGLTQIATRAGIPHPNKVAEYLSQPHLVDHFSEILNLEYSRQKSNYLVRSVGSEVRGFLSDRYKRLDSFPIIEALVEAAVERGAVPIGGHYLPTKVYLKLLLPKVYEPFPNEVMAFGLCFQNSDFGDGALSMRGFVYRLYCTNLAMTEDSFRQVHLGSKFGDDFLFSRRTYELDTQATISAVRDVTSSIFDAELIEKKMEVVKNAAEREIDSKVVIEAMRKKSLVTKGESEKISEIYNGADVQMLPPGNTAWRLSNAISLLAQSCDAARRLDLESLAGKAAGLN